MERLFLSIERRERDIQALSYGAGREKEGLFLIRIKGKQRERERHNNIPPFPYAT